MAKITLSAPKLFGFRPKITLGENRGRRQPPRATAAVEDSSLSFVYVLLGEHRLIKIGYSRNPVARVASLKTGSPFPLSIVHVVATRDDAFVLEQAAHEILSAERCEGEWFDCAVEDAVSAISVAAHRLNHRIETVDPTDVSRWLTSSVKPAQGIHDAHWIDLVSALILKLKAKV